MSNIELPTVLAFNRNLEPSDALMFSGKWEDINEQSTWKKIKLFERRNRAVKSNFKDEVKNNEEDLQKQIAEANLSWGDDANLYHNDDTLKLSFSLRIIPGINEPSVCSQPEFKQVFSEKVTEYIDANLISELAKRYAYNIANARFLWRNRVAAQQIKVTVTHSSLEKPLEFNAYDYSLKKTTSNDANIQQLAELIKRGLINEEKVLLTIDAYAQLGSGQRVWPSQEMVFKLKKGDKSKYLFSLEDQAAMHCEKIGNALRTIDDWYPDYEITQYPIAIEAYGSVTQQGKAYRSNKTDFKTLLLKWLNDKAITEEEKHFVIAMLIRGGVFGEGDS